MTIRLFSPTSRCLCSLLAGLVAQGVTRITSSKTVEQFEQAVGADINRNFSAWRKLTGLQTPTSEQDAPSGPLRVIIGRSVSPPFLLRHKTRSDMGTCG